MFEIGDYVKVITDRYGSIWYNKIGKVTRIYENKDVQVTFIDKIGAFLSHELRKSTEEEYFLDVL
jgi:hypothetical protein